MKLKLILGRGGNYNSKEVLTQNKYDKYHNTDNVKCIYIYYKQIYLTLSLHIR